MVCTGHPPIEEIARQGTQFTGGGTHVANQNKGCQSLPQKAGLRVFGRPEDVVHHQLGQPRDQRQFRHLRANADLARQIVDRAIADWERVIDDFNYTGGGTRLRSTLRPSHFPTRPFEAIRILPTRTSTFKASQQGQVSAWTTMAAAAVGISIPTPDRASTRTTANLTLRGRPSQLTRPPFHLPLQVSPPAPVCPSVYCDAH